jgi:hypothetical protein
MAESYEGVVPVGGDLGTSTSKFCDGEHVVCFSSVAGDPLTEQLAESWRRMNRSTDHRWIRNLAVWDERRSCWRYLGAMTRSSQRPQWYTEGGVIQSFDDAYLALQAGLFLLGVERGRPLGRVALGLGAPIKAGEQSSAQFFDAVRDRLATEGGKRFLPVRAKNLATGEERTERIELAFSVVQFQAYGAYMVLLFSKFGLKLYNTYVIDVGHGTWICLPIVENEADVALADSVPAGLHAITRNISAAIFEKSGQKVKIQEQRIMEKLAAGQREIEAPGAGVFNFQAMLDAECDGLADDIVTRVRQDVGALGGRGVSVDYFAVVGGGARLLTGRLRRRLADWFGWDERMAAERIVGEDALPLDPRYVNAAGFMLLARDQIALELGAEVDPRLAIRTVATDAAAG